MLGPPVPYAERMSKPTRYRYADGEMAPRRGRGRSQPALPVLPVVSFLALLAVAILAARMIGDERGGTTAEAAPAEAGRKPFASVPDEPPPNSKGRTAFAPTDDAPAGLLAGDGTWKRALELAAEAESVFARARKARDTGDMSRWNELAHQAKELFDQAFTMTAPIEEDWIARFGETDRQVREMMRTRTRWQERMTLLHKTTGR